jgi:hypothetical protein
MAIRFSEHSHKPLGHPAFRFFFLDGVMLACFILPPVFLPRFLFGPRTFETGRSTMNGFKTARMALPYDDMPALLV